jgi:hypothetical protein
MNGNFFANYSKFIVVPSVAPKVGKKDYDPQDYATYYILTLSLYDPLLLKWSEAYKYEIDVDKSIVTVLEEFNKKREGEFHLQLLELDQEKSYFVLALSCKDKIENEKANERITYLIEKVLTNPFYVGQGWYKITGEKGRIDRSLFCCSFKEYTI